VLILALLQDRVHYQRSDLPSKTAYRISTPAEMSRLLSDLYFEILSEVDDLTSSPSYQDAQLVRVVDNQILRLRMWASHVEPERIELLEALESDATAKNLVLITRANFEYILELVRCIAKPADSYEDVLEQLEDRLDCLYVIKCAVDDVQNKDQIKQFHLELARAEQVSQSRAQETPKLSAQQNDLRDLSDHVALQIPSVDLVYVPERLIRTAFDATSAVHHDQLLVPDGDSTSTMFDWVRAESISTRSSTTHQRSSTSRASSVSSLSSYGQDSDSEYETRDFALRSSKLTPFNASTDATTPRKDNFTMSGTLPSHDLDWYRILEDTATDELCTWYLRWNFDDVAFAFDRFGLSGGGFINHWRLSPLQSGVLV
jgi:hypothetical protein